MKVETKFNIEKCKKCKYRGAISGATKRHYTKTVVNVICNYSGITGHTCLYSDATNKTCDRRGEEYDNCKLFVEGALMRNKERNVFRSCRF